MTLQTIISLGKFELLLRKMVQKAEVLGITQPSLSRKQKLPAKLLNGNEASLCDALSDLRHLKTHLFCGYRYSE